MYPASNAFHTAVQNGEKQMALLIFEDAVFTDEDINMDSGIEFHDYFNTSENLSIGQTPSNEISFELFNDDRLLNNYEFGDFTATLGVYLDSSVYTKEGNVWIRTSANTYTGMSESPYLLRNGEPMGSPPTFQVASLLAYDGKVWAFSASGQCAVYNDLTGAKVRWTMNRFMQNKVKRWAGLGFVYDGGKSLTDDKGRQSKVLKLYRDGTMDRYEFVPLGKFIGERPNAPDQIAVQMTCYDLMQRLDDDMPSSGELGISYPITLGNLYKKICDYAGVPVRTTTFINSTATVNSEPDEFENSTMRTVIGWIAEAAGSNARVDRDGYMVMDWVRKTSQTYAEGQYSEFLPYWYQTRKVTKLYNRDTANSAQETVGSGKEAYLIQGNPFLQIG